MTPCVNGSCAACRPVKVRSDRALMGFWFWSLIVRPAVKLAEVQGWWSDRQMRHNFGEAE